MYFKSWNSDEQKLVFNFLKSVFCSSKNGKKGGIIVKLFSEKVILMRLGLPLGSVVSLISKVTQTSNQDFYRTLGEAIGNPDIKKIFINILTAEVKITYNINNLFYEVYLEREGSKVSSGWLFTVKNDKSPNGISPKETDYDIKDLLKKVDISTDIDDKIDLIISGPVSLIASIIDEQSCTRRGSFFANLKKEVKDCQTFPYMVDISESFGYAKLLFDDGNERIMFANNKDNRWGSDIRIHYDGQ